MSFIAPLNFESLEGQPKKGNGQCVRLLEAIITHMPTAAFWKEGARVKGNFNIPKGTAIATFMNGIYPNHHHGNHAAIYIGQDAQGIWVIDQFVSTKPHYQKINKRLLHFGRHEISDNGDAFSVIEISPTKK